MEGRAIAKIVEGIALLVSAVVLTVVSAGLLGPGVALDVLFAVAGSSASLGVSLLTAGISRALGFGPAESFTVREPAAFRQVVYGQTRIAGVVCYLSTSQSHNHLNQVVCWSTNQLSSIDQIYLDGRQVIPSSGTADSNNHTDDSGNQYNFEGCVYTEHNLGTPAGHWFSSLYNSDPSWASSATLCGIGSSFIQCTYSDSVFPNDPSIKAGVHGAIVWDLRLGDRFSTEAMVYSNNASLCFLDCLLSTVYGLGASVSEIDQDAFVAAANLCDELVPLNSGLYESRYTINGFFSTDSPAGTILTAMLQCMAGRLLYIGGQYALYPGAWYGSGAVYDESSVISSVRYTAKRKARDLFNSVRTSFISPPFPYAQVGFDQSHKNPDVFGGEYSVFDAPEFAQDVLHGYPSDANLIQDGGEKRYLDLSLRFTTSVATAQRCAKIFLLRNRFQASMTMDFNLSVMLSQPQDCIQIYFNALGLTSQYWEIDAMRFNLSDDDSSEESQDGSGIKAKKCTVSVDLVSTSPACYLWSPSEELTLQSGPSPVIGNTFIANPPTGLTLESGSDSAIIGLDGIVTPRINAQWSLCDDPAILSGGSQEVQLMHTTTGVWQSVGFFSPTITQIFIMGVVCAQTYDVRVRGIRSNGTSSAWAETDSHTVSTTLSSITYEGASLGSLSGLNFVDFSTGEVINKTANNMTYSNSLTVEELRPAQSLADQTAGKSLDILADGTTYARPLGNQLLSGFVVGKSSGSQMLGNPGFEQNLTGALPFNQVSSTLGLAVCDDWFIGETQGVFVTCAQVASTQHTGAANLVMFIPENTAVAAFQSLRVLSSKMPVIGNAQLTYSGFLGWQTSGVPIPAGAELIQRIGLYFWDINGAFLAEEVQQVVHYGGEIVNLNYFQLSGQCTVPPTASTASFQCSAFNFGGSAFNTGSEYPAIWRFDDCSCTQQFTSSSILNPQGSVMPNQAQILTYSTTSSSCTFTASGGSMARADGTSLTTVANTFTFTGLSASTTYYTYWYVDVASGDVNYTNSFPPPTTPSSLDALNTGLDGRISIGVISFTTTASSGSTGGGSGGGGGICPEASELVAVQGRGNIRADEVKVGDKIRGKSFFSGTDVYRKVIAVNSTSNAAWRVIDGHRVTPCDTVWDNDAWTPAYRVERGTFDPMISRSIKITVDAGGEENGSNFYLVAGTELLSHNSTYHPC